METRYSIDEVKQVNKIVGVKLPQFKKVQWAIWDGRKLFLRKPIRVYTANYSVKDLGGELVTEGKYKGLYLNYEFEWDCYGFDVESGAELQFNRIMILQEDNTYDKEYPRDYLIPLESIVSVDISKVNVRPEIQKMGLSHLLSELNSTRRRGIYSEDEFQYVLELKAELLKRPEKKKKKQKKFA
jgi:hypothetical protein